MAGTTINYDTSSNLRHRSPDEIRLKPGSAPVAPKLIKFLETIGVELVTEIVPNGISYRRRLGRCKGVVVVSLLMADFAVPSIPTGDVAGLAFLTVAVVVLAYPL